MEKEDKETLNTREWGTVKYARLEESRTYYLTKPATWKKF